MVRKLVAGGRMAALGCAALVATAFGGESLFAPSAKLAKEWTAHVAGSTASVDHGAWAALLSAYLVVRSDGVDRFDYGAVSDADRKRLDDYLNALAATQVSELARPEQMAFWINLYNALTVQVVLDHYPVKSIRDIDISPGLFADGPWDKDLIEVEGRPLSLNDVEHRILRPIWKDARIHYAVNCASIGCPELARRPYLAESLDRDLDAAARAFVNSPEAVRISSGRIVVSKIYDWFVEDFGGGERGVLDHLKAYAAPELRQRLEAINDLEETQYDWRLNDVAGQ